MEMRNLVKEKIAEKALDQVMTAWEEAATKLENL